MITSVLVLLEWGLIGAGFGAAIAAGGGQHPIGWLDLTTSFGWGFVLSLCFVTAFYYQNLYDLRAVGSFRRFLARLPRTSGVALVLFAPVWLLTPSIVVWKAVLLPLLGTAGVLVVARALLYMAIHHRPFARRTLVLGTGPLAARIGDEIRALPGSEASVAAVAEDGTRRRVKGLRILGTLADLAGIIARNEPDQIVVALEDRRGRLPARRLIEARVRGITVEEGVDVYERLTGKIAIESLAPSALAFSPDFRCSRLQPIVARLTSVLAAAAGLLATAPLFPLLALLIKLDSSGPVFFSQDRVGLGGRKFRLVKFRTMRPRTGRGSEWAGDNGDRITRVGRFLRKFRLDELPQLVNILRGEMNLIGPRPHPVSNYDLFMRTVPYYWIRAMVRPGVTGWAQVRYGYADNLEEETEKMRYDLYYIKHRSILMDARILLDTVTAVLGGGGEIAPRQPQEPPHASPAPLFEKSA